MPPPQPRGRRPSLTHLLSLLTLLFLLRVLAQALQSLSPQPWLPPFHAFQGSTLPYPTLLAAQLAILALMTAVTLRIARQRQPRRPSLGRVLAWLGGIYMAASLLRIAIGLTIPGAPSWFSTWIPAVFHVVLAGWVLTLAAHHLGRPPDLGQPAARSA